MQQLHINALKQQGSNSFWELLKICKELFLRIIKKVEKGSFAPDELEQAQLALY